MEEEIQLILEMAEEAMRKSIGHLDTELAKIRAGKATPSMLDSVQVDYYGNASPLNQMCNINTLDAHTLSIQPWEKNMLENIEKAIMSANIGLNPQNNGEVIIINVPPLTEERRQSLVKQANTTGEDTKIGVRNARKEAMTELRNLEKDGAPEDAIKRAEERAQKLTDKYSAKVDDLVAAKEKTIMVI